MTNAELIATIRNKVNKQFNVFLNLSNASQEYGYHKALEYVLHILSDLEKSEKPMNQEELEKEIENTWEKLEKDYSPAALDKTTILVSGLVGEKQFSKIVHYFYDLGKQSGSLEIPKDAKAAAEQFYQQDGFDSQAARELGIACFVDGAKWQAELNSCSEIPKDLEEAKKKWAESHYLDSVSQEICADDFAAGAKWQKELMMGGAIEAVARPLDKEIWCDLDKFPELEDGDDIRIIIIKEN